MLLCLAERLHHELLQQVGLIRGGRLHEARHGTVADAVYLT